MEVRRLCETIQYIPASSNPLSADVVLIKTPEFTCIYDVGSCFFARREIGAVCGRKIIVLSHFHTDHTANIPEITFDKLYGGKETIQHTGAGTVVDGEVWLFRGENAIRILPIPSTHAKGSLLLCYGTKYAFCGDACYSAAKKGKPFYNAQLLKAQIDLLAGLDVEYLALSHDEELIHPKEQVLLGLREVYAKREKGSSEIWLDGMP